MVEPVEVYACDMELTGLSKQEGKFVSQHLNTRFHAGLVQSYLIHYITIGYVDFTIKTLQQILFQNKQTSHNY